jgi:hypothetical protein
MPSWRTVTQLVRRAPLALAVACLVACGDSRTRSGSDAGSGDPDASGRDASTTECPAGESHFDPGCGSGEEVVITAGCYRPCTGATDGSCTAGTTCRRTDINPCICPAGEGCCAACGAEQWLCLAPGGGDTDPYELGALDESCEGIVTGRQILDAIEESYTATFDYIDGSPSTELSLTFIYESGTLLCHPAIPAPPGSGAPDQPAYLDVEMTAQIATADGAFDETATATLTAYAADAPVELRARLDVTTLVGTFEPRLMDLTTHGITFGGQLMGPTTSGTAVEGGTRSTGVGETLGVGSWSTGS